MVYIGLCGWDSRALYEPGVKAQDKLEIYSDIYPTVEINSTFYNIPSTKNVDSWYLTVPKDFHFSVKLNRLFSHDSGLVLTPDVQARLPEFISHTSRLEDKLSWYLLQLPPSQVRNDSGLDEFLAFLRATLESQGVQADVAVEFRHSSWYTAELSDILDRHGAAQVISSSPGKWPCVWVKQAKANYIRLHGLHEMYHSAYTSAELEKLRDWITDSGAERSWVYFDNAASSAGKENSQYLMTLFGQSVPEQTRQLRMDLPE